MRTSARLIRWSYALLLVVGVWGWSPTAQAQSSECVPDLDRLRGAGDDAHDAARRSSAAQREASIAQQQYLRCAQLTVDEPFDAGCRQQQSASNSAQATATAAAEQLRGAFDALAAAVQTVELSCEFPLAGMVSIPDRSDVQSGSCESFLRRRSGVPLNTLRVLCDGEMTAEECTACLADR